MPITHTFVSAVSDGADTTLVRPTNWNADHTITCGTATLGASGTATVSNSAVTTAAKVFLNRMSGNSNMAIYVSAVSSGVSFTITSAGGADDASLSIGWMII